MVVGNGYTVPTSFIQRRWIAIYMQKGNNGDSSIHSFNRVANKDPDNNHSTIGGSGNSDVDIYINIEVDTRPIGYAMLCSLLATKQISNEDFEHAVLKWEHLSYKKDKESSLPPERAKHSNVPGLRLFGPTRS